MDWTTMSRAESLSVPDRLSIDLERLILDGKLERGEKLPTERELTVMLGVSRVSIRQALHELESRGLIERTPGRGTIVVTPGSQTPEATRAIGSALGSVDAVRPEIEFIMELRSILEPPIAGITAERAMPRDVAQLRNLVEEMENDAGLGRYAELDRSFHQSIAQYTHNPLLALLNEQISELIAPSRDSTLETEDRRQSSSAAHRRIYEAIAAHDPAAAEREARAHIDGVRDQIVLAERALRASRTRS
jgi:GntR family transcriptional repressor for pyruvate dehydrogenase complex